MKAGLFEALGIDSDDLSVREAREDARQHTDLIVQLVARRKHLGLNQKHVAEKLGTTQSAVSDFERVGGNPTLMTLQRYARAVNARLATIVRAKDAVYNVDHGWREIALVQQPKPHKSHKTSPTLWTDVERTRVG